jgi:hypothetical protein
MKRAITANVNQFRRFIGVSSVVFCALANPSSNDLNRAVWQVRSSLRHPIAEWRIGGELLYYVACVGFSGDDHRSVVPTPEQLCDRLHKQATAPAVAAIAAALLENRFDLRLE